MTRTSERTSSPLPGRINVAGLRCSTCTVPELLRVIRHALAVDEGGLQPLSVLCVNAHIFNLAWGDPVLHRRLEQADVLALDGVSMVWAARRAATSADPVLERCAMSDAFRAFLDARDMPPSRALLIGLDIQSALRAARTINARAEHCRVVSVLDGYQDVATYRAALQDSDVELVLVGCGTPRSEAVVTALAVAGRGRLLWHVGGGTLKFLAGSAREAPAWMRRSGLQWVHRLASQPRAMWRRYLLGNPTFVWRVLRGTGARTRS